MELLISLILGSPLSGDDKALRELRGGRESRQEEFVPQNTSRDSLRAGPQGVITWDFETSDGGFTAPPDWRIQGCWGWDSPTAGPGGAHSGSMCWGTAPNDPYDPNADWRLIMPTQNFSGLSHPILNFWHWYDTESGYDSGWVEVSTNGGATWTKVSPSYRGTSGGWLKTSVDLSAYGGQASVDIRFRFTSDGTVQYDGWYIDDVEIVDIAGMVNYYTSSYEGTNGGLTVVGSSPAPWQRGVPNYASGPASAYDGNECWATNLTGDYNANAQQAIRSGNINISGNTYAEMSFWRWYDTETGYDTCHLQVSSDGGSTWTTIMSYAGHDGGAWTHDIVDVSAYISNQFRFRFAFDSDGSIQYPGFYLDSVRISAGNPTQVAFWDFEADSGNYTADPFNPPVNMNEWEWGSPPGIIGAHSGTRCWGTDLNDVYGNDASMILQGPITDVSNVGSWPQVILDFWHWRDAESADTSIVEVSSDGGTTWNRVATYTNTFRAWRAESLNVTPYRSANFTFRFILKTDGSVSDTGWYIDDVELDTVAPTLTPVTGDPVYISQGYVALYLSNLASDGYGTYTAATDTLHGWGPDISLLFAGGSHDPWSSYLTVRCENSHTDYTASQGVDSTLPPYSLDSLNNYLVGIYRIHGNEDSVITIWDGLPEGLRIEQHTYALGTTQSDARIQIMTHVINNSASNRTVSVRYEWDTHISTTDAPFIRGNFGSWGPWFAWEDHWWADSIAQYYEENQNPTFGTPFWHYISSKWAPWPPDPTDPDTFFFVRWPLAYNTAFDVPYMADGRDSLGGNWDDCVCFMWVNRTIAPGDTFTVVEYIWSPMEPVYFSLDENQAKPRVGLFGPNPLRAGGDLSFGLSQNQRVEIKLYSVDGRLVKTLFSGQARAGLHRLRVPKVVSGTYFLIMRAEADGYFSRKLVVGH